MLSIGIDLGGTNIAAGVVTSEGKVIAQAQRPTLAQRPWQQVVEDMAEVSLDALAMAGVGVEQVHAIGVGVPGNYDRKNGVVVFCTNLGWHNVPLREAMRRYIDVPLYADNDANVAAFAEAMAGASRNVYSSLLLTLGTGVGSGIIVDGKIWSGSHGVAGEVGHMIYRAGGEQCTCGQRGCFERYASATALIRIAREATMRYPDSEMKSIPPERMNAKTVVDAARRGDEAAMEAFDEYTTHLSLGIVSCINVFDPEMIVLGGGVSRAGDFLLEPVRRKVEKQKFFKALPIGGVELATLGNDAGIIGAALLHRT